jgi:hypothetical protein
LLGNKQERHELNKAHPEWVWAGRKPDFDVRRGEAIAPHAHVTRCAVALLTRYGAQLHFA